ncbi:MAG TPA: aminodeoxychorismate/anthranilate synthase component II [Gemmatimonadota bacterium]|nr:aminodeoxychorismate/anthranilate synthase component II [Gemmatimonadota bacterium]
MNYRVVVIDNYDSFTWNLVQALYGEGREVIVRRNDAVDADSLERLAPTHVVISPGPGRPEDAGATCAIVKRWSGRVPVLGVCLGHQAIAHVLGGRVERAPRVVHGQASRVYHDGRSLYSGVSNPLQAGRYHSLIVSERELPPDLEVSAYTSEGEIMGLRVAGTRTEGVQFHPESILTADGPRLIANFLRGTS